MRVLNTLSKRLQPSAAEPSTAERVPANQESELSRLAKILERALPEKDRQLMGHLFRGASRERLCWLFKISIDELKAEVARVRWQFKAIVERHGFHRSGNPAVQRFIKKTYSVLSN